VLRGSAKGVKGLLRRVRRLLRDEQAAPYVWLYTKSGATLRGALVGRDREAYTLAHADVAPEGATGFRQLHGRVRVPSGNIDYYVVSTPDR
jgi:hypothetical protein